jgi:hypothetical protein
LYFPSPTVAAETRVRRPFTRSSTHKEDAETEVISKYFVPKKDRGKGDTVGKPIEVMTKDFVQKKEKGKGENTKRRVEVINITTPLDNPTFNRLIIKLKDGRKEVARLKGERLTERRNMSELMDRYNETLDISRFTSRRLFPLHKKHQTFYRKNISIQSQNIKLKEELHPFKDDLAQRNLNVLDQDAIERNSPTIEINVAAIEGSALATRRSARLRR